MMEGHKNSIHFRSYSTAFLAEWSKAVASGAIHLWWRGFKSHRMHFFLLLVSVVVLHSRMNEEFAGRTVLKKRDFLSTPETMPTQSLESTSLNKLSATPVQNLSNETPFVLNGFDFDQRSFAEIEIA